MKQFTQYIKSIQLHPKMSLVAGIAFTFTIAWISFGLAMLPGLNQIGPLACAILLAVIYRQIWGYPVAIRTGIQFCSKTLLRCAIILYGLKLNMNVILHEGMGLLVRDAAAVLLAIGLTVILAKWMKADKAISLLLGIGTGVCGAAAIAAVSPILKTKEEDTAISIGLIALIGTIFAIGYTILRPYLPISAEQYGLWSGISLHEIAHVALAGAPAGEEALSYGLLAKLGRVLLLVPLCFILMAWMKRKNKDQQDKGNKIEFPWFLIGFIVMSLLGSYVFDQWLAASPNIANQISNFTTFLLTMAMIGLGLNVHFRELRSKALRPAITMTVVSVVLSMVTFLII